MNAAAIIDFVSNLFPYGFIKLSVLLVLGIYIIFAFIILQQERLMSRVVEIPASSFLRLVAVVHVIAALAIFVAALFLL